jgi:RNA polymerase sigma-70 factor (ECF subfamily)
MAVWDAVGATRRDARPRIEERRLVERLRAGDGAAIEELYLAYRKPIFGFLVRLAKDRHLAEDLFQNTWVKVSRAAVHLREDSELRAWVFAIARNEYRSWRRWQMMDPTRIFLLGKERETASESEGGEVDHLEKALAMLGPSDREVLLIVCAHGIEQEEAAKVLGISHAALRQRLGRARARLKDAIATLDGTRSDERAAKGKRT